MLGFSVGFPNRHPLTQQPQELYTDSGPWAVIRIAQELTPLASLHIPISAQLRATEKICRRTP